MQEQKKQVKHGAVILVLVLGLQLLSNIMVHLGHHQEVFQKLPMDREEQEFLDQPFYLLDTHNLVQILKLGKETVQVGQLKML